jgi:hypothetical protein
MSVRYHGLTKAHADRIMVLVADLKAAAITLGRRENMHWPKYKAALIDYREADQRLREYIQGLVILDRVLNK